MRTVSSLIETVRPFLWPGTVLAIAWMYRPHRWSVSDGTPSDRTPSDRAPWDRPLSDRPLSDRTPGRSSAEAPTRRESFPRATSQKPSSLSGPSLPRPEHRPRTRIPASCYAAVDVPSKQLRHVAEAWPRSAVVSAWPLVELAAFRAARRAAFLLPRTFPNSHVMRLLGEEGLLPAVVESQYPRLRDLRNQAAHATEREAPISREDARTYLHAIERVIAALDGIHAGNADRGDGSAPRSTGAESVPISASPSTGPGAPPAGRP